MAFSIGLNNFSTDFDEHFFELDEDELEALEVFTPLIQSSLFLLEYPINDSHIIERIKKSLYALEKNYAYSNDYKDSDFLSPHNLFKQIEALSDLYTIVLNHNNPQLSAEELFNEIDYIINESYIYRSTLSDDCTRLLKAILYKSLEDNKK